MQIRYDRLVLEQAKSEASQPHATQRDMQKFMTDHYWTDYGHCVSYLSPETREQIYRIMLGLPRRARNSPGKTRQQSGVRR